MPAPGTITTERERELIAIAQTTLGSYPKDPFGIWARNTVVEANMPLASAIAKKAPYFGMTFSEVKSAGYLGLIEAVLRFDLERRDPDTGRHIAFSTYAYWVIRGIITRENFVRDRSFGVGLRLIVNSSAVHGMDFNDHDWGQEYASSWEPENSQNEEIAYDPDIVGVILDHWDHSPFLSRLAIILRIRFGFGRDPGTLDECGIALGGVTKERARQLQSKAFERFRQDYEHTVKYGVPQAKPPVHIVRGKAWSA